jgi:hypothetical protein
LDADDVVATGWVAAMEAAAAVHEFVVGPLEYGRLNPKWAIDVRGILAERRLLLRRRWAALAGGLRREPRDLAGTPRSESVVSTRRCPGAGRMRDYSGACTLWGAIATWVPDAVVHYA